MSASIIVKSASAAMLPCRLPSASFLPSFCGATPLYVLNDETVFFHQSSAFWPLCVFIFATQ